MITFCFRYTLCSRCASKLPLGNFVTTYKSKKSFSSVARPQANGQVKAINKTINHNLKTKLEDQNGRWVDELPEVLWPYRTTTRTNLRNSILTLIWRNPVEIGISLLRRENYDPDQNNLLQRCELDFLEVTWFTTVGFYLSATHCQIFQLQS